MSDFASRSVWSQPPRTRRDRSPALQAPAGPAEDRARPRNFCLPTAPRDKGGAPGRGHPRPHPWTSAELLGQPDDDAFGATHEAEQVDVLVLRDLADEFGTVAAQAGDDVVDVVDHEHDAAHAQRVRRGAFRLGSDRRRRVEPRQLDPAVAVRGPHHGDVGTDALEPDRAVGPGPLDRRLAFQLHTEFGEERFGSLEVVDNDEHVVHSLNHVVLLALWAASVAALYLMSGARQSFST